MRCVLQLLVFCCSVFLGVSEWSFTNFARDLMMKDFTNINDNLLNLIVFEVDTTTFEKEVIRQFFQVLFQGHIEIEAYVGGLSKLPGSCQNFNIDELLGDVTVKGVLAPGTYNFGGTQMQRYDITLAGTRFQFDCNIPLTVVLTELFYIGPIDLTGIQDTSAGNLYFASSEVNFSETISVYSRDFALEPPVVSEVGVCTSSIGGVTVDAEDTLSLFDNLPDLLSGLTINLDGQVEDALRADLGIITDPIREVFCDLFTDLAAEVGSFIVTNPLTEGEVFELQDDPFSPNAGAIAALEVENNLNTSGQKIFDFTKANFLVDIFFPKGGDQENDLIGDFFSTIPVTLGNETVDQTDALGLVIGIINDVFGTNYARNPVSELLENFDLLEFINRALNFVSTDPPLPLDSSFVIIDLVEVTEFGTFSVSLNLTAATLTEKVRGVLDGGFLGGLEIIGKHTVLLPEISLGDFEIDATFDVLLSAESNDITSDLLPVYNIDIPLETFFMNDAVWKEFRGGLAALLAILEDDLFDLQLGPLLDFPLDCFISTLFELPELTGLSVSSGGIDASVSGFSDFILFLIGDVLNVALFTYQSLGSRVMEFLLKDALLGLKFFEEEECPPLDVFPNDTSIYNFSEGLFQEIVAIADAEFFEGLIDFALDREGNSDLFAVINEEFAFSFDLFPINGWSQLVEFSLFSLNVKGLIPPTVNNGSLTTPATSVNFPQGIVAEVEAGEEANPIGIIAGIRVDLGEPFVPDDLNGTHTAEPPSILTNASNTMYIDIDFDSIYLMAEIFAKMSLYDVESITIRDAFNIDCWVSRLTQPGGWYEIEVVLAEMGAAMECECDTPLFNALEVAIESGQGLVELLPILQDFANILVGLLRDQYDDDNWNRTVTNAELRCAGLPELEPLIIEIEELTEDQTTAWLLVSFLAASLSFTVPLYAMRSRGRNAPKVGEGGIDYSGEGGNNTAVAAVGDRNKDENTEEYYIALVRNPLVPRYVRWFIPTLVCGNTAMFIYGDTGVAVKNSLAGSLFGAPLELKDFGDFSVITSTIALYENGAYGLAIMITVLVIVWPYLKLLGIMSCWVLPPRWGTGVPSRLRRVTISFKMRGRLLHFMDSFGKWSLIEIYFIIFLRLVFEVSIGTPDVAFLPEEDLYRFNLLIAPQLSLYTFATAVVLSIFASNIGVYWHDKVKHENEAKKRERDMIERQQNIADVYKEPMIVDCTWVFKRDSPNAYGITFTTRGIRALLFLVLVCFILLMIASGTFAIKVKYLGLAATLMELEGESSVKNYSVFGTLGIVFERAIAQADPGSIFFAFVFVFSLTFMPILFMLLSVYMVLGRFTTRTAKTFLTWRTIVGAWCAVEVFVLALGISKLEVATVAGYLVDDQCSFLTEFMRDYLLPLGLVTEDDVAATCFALEVELIDGTFYLVFYVFFMTLTGYIINRLFNSQLNERIVNMQKENPYIDNVPGAEVPYGESRVKYAKPSCIHWVWKKLGLVRVFPYEDPNASL